MSCVLEHFPVLINEFNSFLEQSVERITKMLGLRSVIKSERVEGTTYAEYIDGKWKQKELNEHITEFKIQNRVLEEVDLDSFREEFYKKCRDSARMEDKEIFNALEGTPYKVDIDGSKPPLDIYFQILKQGKKFGNQGIIRISPELYDLILTELNKSENFAKIKKEWIRIYLEEK